MRHSLEFAATRNLVQDPRARRGRRAPGYASHCAGQYLGSVRPLDKYLVERYFKNTGFSILMLFAVTLACSCCLCSGC